MPVCQTKHKNTATITSTPGTWTYGYIREQTRSFTGYSPQSGRSTLGPVWCALGPTAREGLIDSQVLRILFYASKLAAVTFTVDEIRALRRAFIEECEAQGYMVHDREPFYASDVPE